MDRWRRSSRGPGLAGEVWYWSARRSPPATPVPGAAARRRVDLTFAAAVVVTLAAGIGALLWLLDQANEVPPGKDRAAARADAVKTGAAIALGTGGAAYLLLAYRRQRLEEVDTRERRITELYTKAVEELGHEKAPVRLGALYSLERLAQNNPEHRHTVVDVVCAYLRMPYTVPARSEPDAKQMGEAASVADDRDRPPHPLQGREPSQQELQVRQTAQRILAAHLQLREGTSNTKATKTQRRRPSSRQAFWPGTSLDLTGATLVDIDFTSMSVVYASFDGAIFHGDTSFDGATFHGIASFVAAIFHRGAGFDEAIFHGDAWFSEATFHDRARLRGTHDTASFDRATFHGTAGFEQVTFQGDAGFDGATFDDGAGFDGATFHGIASFVATTFHRAAGFDGATFHGIASFVATIFHRGASFDGATFHGTAGFEQVTFPRDAGFDEAPFHGDQGPVFPGARVLHLDDPDLSRVWPDGYTVRPDPTDATRGTLIYTEQAEEPERAVPAWDRPAGNGLGTSPVDRQDR